MSQEEAVGTPEAYQYPEQRHAGAVGLGPEFGKGASGGDKLTGWKEELVGTITHNREKLQHGHDLRTGEVKRREQEQDQEENPFQKAGEDKQAVEGKASQSSNNSPGPEEKQNAGNSNSAAVNSRVDENNAVTEAQSKDRAEV